MADKKRKKIPACHKPGGLAEPDDSEEKERIVTWNEPTKVVLAVSKKTSPPAKAQQRLLQ